MEYNSFEDMPVWQKAMDLAVKIFKLTERLPRKEDYGLTSQIRSSGLNDKLKFYYNARGSLAETKNHLIYGYKVGYFIATELKELSNLIKEIWRELNSLISSLSKRS
jgi:hypothetical protein